MDAERRRFGDTPLPPTRTEATNGVRKETSGGPLPPFRSGFADQQAAPESVAAESVAHGEAGADEAEEFQILPITDALAEEQRGTSVAASTAEPADLDDFPLDAFIIPDDAQRLPTGLQAADRQKRQRATDLADRLEALASRLRREGYSALARETVGGDPVGALISGILAGYLAAQDE
jgi:hypothetical protein